MLYLIAILGFYAQGLPQPPAAKGGGVHGQDLVVAYSNVDGSYYTAGGFPNRAIDDIILAPGITCISSIDFCFALVGAGPIDLRVEVSFYDHLDYDKPTAPLNTGHLGTFVVVFPHLQPQILRTNQIDITPQLGVLCIPDGTVGVKLAFKDNVTGELTTRASPMFARVSSVGSSLDFYANDQNNNDIFDPGEKKQLGGWPFLANFVLELRGPEVTVGTVMGHIDLQPYGNPAGLGATMEFRSPGSTTPLFTRPITLDSNGNYTINSVTAATYDMAVKFSHWLRKRATNVTVSGTTLVDFVCKNGDVAEDNTIGVFDLNGVLVGFGKTGDPADLDGDGSVNVLDLNAILVNFALIGDP